MTESAKSFDLPLLVFHLRNVSPFFGALALFAEMVTTDSVDTAATDGRRLFFNSDFMAAHPVKEQLGILVHELLHAALRHVKRRSGADPDIWNIAADIVVNDIISKTSGIELPKSALMDPKLAGFSVEEVYQILLKRRKITKSILFIGSDLLDPSTTEDEMGEHWNSALAQAVVVSQMSGASFGKLPEGLVLAIAAVSDPPLDWRTLLWRHLTRTPVDFASFDRRFLGEELYLEALDGETVHVGVCVDTSGSIEKNELSRFFNEIRGILAAYPSITVDLYTCDTELRGPWKLESADCPIPQIVGGGGTSFEPFFSALDAAVPPPGIAVYLTDGYGKFPKNAPLFPVLWVVTPGGMASSDFPFGDTARMLGE